MGDQELAANLARAAGVVGMPTFGEGKLTFALMPAVVQAVILYGKSLLLLKGGGFGVVLPWRPWRPWRDADSVPHAKDAKGAKLKLGAQ